jgi:cytoskeletal protein RodZ
MTRTDVMASSRPQAEGAGKVRLGSVGSRRRLIVLPVVLLLAVALVAPVSAVAAGTTTNKEGLTGYEKKSEEKSGTSPSKETKTAEKEPAPTTTSTTSTTPTSSTSPSSETSKSSTLPFTGLDLRWLIGMGLFLSGAGLSIVTVQRRHRRDGR